MSPKKTKPVSSQKSQTVKSEALYTFDELKEVWYFSMLHGATLWQYCQDTNKLLPSTFEKGIAGLLSKVTTPHALQDVLKSRALMVGLFEELATTNTTTADTVQEEKQLDTSLQSVK